MRTIILNKESLNLSDNSKNSNFANSMNCKFFILIFFLLFVLLVIPSCRKDKPITSNDAKLNFSTDSILFDTVFTTLGSTTKIFKMYNPYNQSIVVSKAYIGGGSNSPFRINIDGVSGPSVQDIELLPKDSLFVFVQVTVNPTGANAPLLIKDSIVFETNGNLQNILLSAIGQDVYLHKPNIFPTDGSAPYCILPCINTWTNDKPHLIFGTALVNTDSVLLVNAGARIYMNKGAILSVAKGGSLLINGAKGSEVTFQGSRLESDYTDIAGQWGKIWLQQGSKNNVINWAIIKNGNIGVQADSMGTSGNPLLVLTNTIIKNMSSTAVYAQLSHINSYNCVFANCGQYLAALTNGGNYTFRQCTFANYYLGIRNSPLLYLNNYSAVKAYNLDSAFFGNCIIYGNLTDEVEFDKSTGTFNYTFENCLVKTTINMSNDGLYYSTVYTNNDPGFVDISKNNYQLNATSFAVDKGFTNTISTDLNNKPRPNPTTSIPDLGAYEQY